jgi:hypothetical protein
MACLVLHPLLAFFLVLEFIVLKVLVRPRCRSVGVAFVSSARCRLLKGSSGLSFCGREETNLDPFVFQGCEETVDAVGVAVDGLCVKEAGVSEAFCDSLLSREGLLALEAANVGKSRLDGLRDSLVCPNGRVVDIPGVRSFRYGSGYRMNCCQSSFERRVRGRKVNAIARWVSIFVAGGNSFFFC